MTEHTSAGSRAANQGHEDGPGIPWEAGEEDYPFAAMPGEAALEYFQRWLQDAGYARVERNGARYVHETDVTNVVNHITADVSLLRARLDQFGDRVVTSADHAATVERIERALAQLDDALAIIRGGDHQKS
jgi:arginase family enzyme